MGQICWEELGNGFRLVCGPFCGFIDPSRPGCGLHELQIEGWKLSGTHLLGIRWVAPHQNCAALFRPGSSAESAHRGGCILRDCWTCGGNLLAEYVPQVGEDASLVARWRLVPSSLDSPSNSLTLDLLLSLQSIEFETYAQVCVVSWLEAEGAWVPTDEGATQLQPQVPRDKIEHARMPVVLLKIPGSNWWYQEMAHPSDVVEAGLQAEGGTLVPELSAPPAEKIFPPGNLGYWGSWYRLFSERVERGLILRARVRGRFFQALTPEPFWRDGWEAFLEAPAPLGD
jgi:hypothetical protein